MSGQAQRFDQLVDLTSAAYMRDITTNDISSTSESQQ